jgi:hypothetical protein
VGHLSRKVPQTQTLAERCVAQNACDKDDQFDALPDTNKQWPVRKATSPDPPIIPTTRQKLHDDDCPATPRTQAHNATQHHYQNPSNEPAPDARNPRCLPKMESNLPQRRRIVRISFLASKLNVMPSPNMHHVPRWQRYNNTMRYLSKTSRNLPPAQAEPIKAARVRRVGLRCCRVTGF